MRKASTRQLQKLQSAQAAIMDDLCNIYHITRSSGTYSTHGTETRSVVSGVACGIEFVAENIRTLQSTPMQSPQTVVMDYDAILRLPATVSVFVTDEIELVEKGMFMVSGTFQPANPPRINSTVQHIQIKRMVT